MRCGVIGLGKLGGPLAVALGLRHNVVGYDCNSAITKFRLAEYDERGVRPEDSIKDALEKSSLSLTSRLSVLVDLAEVIFVVVQTPHQPHLDGSHPYGGNAEDFDYSHLIKCAHELSSLVRLDQIVVVSSTVLPGTMRQHILPILQGRCRVAYQPFFCAMGQVLQDFFNPEFVLLGTNEPAVDLTLIYKLYDAFFDASERIVRMSIESAELTKMGYNTAISQRIAFINSLAEIAHRISGCNIDEVSAALSRATQRLLSPRYLRAGNGDGGACHPRDLIALDYLYRKVTPFPSPSGLFGNLLHVRDEQAAFLADVLVKEGKGLPKVILGKSFKAESKITTGSASLLVGEMLARRLGGWHFEHYDPLVDHLPWWHEDQRQGPPRAYLIATKHQCFEKVLFPPGSVVVDPHRYITPQEGVKIIPVGIGV